MTTIRWLESPAASALYSAAAATVGRQSASTKMAEALAAPTRELVEAATAAGATPSTIWPHLVPLSAAIAAPRELVSRAWAAAGLPAPGEENLARLATAVAAVSDAFLAAVPSAASELALRSGPLREQWEARGPGLLATIGRSTEQRLLVERAEVLVVHPVGGSGGEAYSPQTTVAIEGVLANPLPQLPEVVRLAWLVTSLGLARVPSDEPIAADRWTWLGRLALVPAVLAAAEHVELARCDKETLRLALIEWRLVVGNTPEQAEGLASILDTWWKIYRLAPAPWPAALSAIDRISKGPR